MKTSRADTGISKRGRKMCMSYKTTALLPTMTTFRETHRRSIGAGSDSKEDPCFRAIAWYA
jgi:hypothetical protein